MIAFGLGSIALGELVAILVALVVQLAFYFLIIYSAVRVALRYGPAELIDRFTASFGRAEERTARLVRRLRSREEGL